MFDRWLASIRAERNAGLRMDKPRDARRLAQRQPVTACVGLSIAVSTANIPAVASGGETPGAAVDPDT
ncbi:hypothetical protein T31B1_17588 [Salinisphaera sp. T31B1]